MGTLTPHQRLVVHQFYMELYELALYAKKSTGGRAPAIIVMPIDRCGECSVALYPHAVTICNAPEGGGTIWDIRLQEVEGPKIVRMGLAAKHGTHTAKDNWTFLKDVTSAFRLYNEAKRLRYLKPKLPVPQRRNPQESKSII